MVSLLKRDFMAQEDTYAFHCADFITSKNLATQVNESASEAYSWIPIQVCRQTPSDPLGKLSESRNEDPAILSPGAYPPLSARSMLVSATRIGGYARGRGCHASLSSVFSLIVMA